MAVQDADEVEKDVFQTDPRALSMTVAVELPVSASYHCLRTVKQLSMPCRRLPDRALSGAD